MGEIFYCFPRELDADVLYLWLSGFFIPATANLMSLGVYRLYKKKLKEGMVCCIETRHNKHLFVVSRRNKEEEVFYFPISLLNKKLCSGDGRFADGLRSKKSSRT